ncbi:19945_t:CDS:2 [Cetraspora pellucida]|uniref:19945_t:CDS:1 n=1 Tax=Cetraspora pellucida TaxID=1433469 RepID=A0A9N9CC68_9GLOM|nr:19945_t:CDS:2 [Cetraspora pellucida]
MLNLSFQITEIQKNITKEQEWLKKLKRHASNQQKFQEKKLKALNKKSIVSAYNLVERSMATLLEKITEITLKIDQFGNHLNLHDEVYPINGKPVYIKYIDKQNDLCTKVRFTTPKETGMQDLKENDSLVSWS